MKFQTTVFLIISSTCIRSAHTQRDPSNITRAVDEEDVFIPCQAFEFRPTLPIWRINGKDYTSATLPSFFSQVPGGLFIKRVHRCFDGYTFQCIDTSGDGLVGQSSSIGTLTVTSSIPCPVELLIMFENTLFFTRETIELDHERIEFGNENITLFWKIFSVHRDCNSSMVHSYPQCKPNDVQFINITNKTYITVPSEISGMPSSNIISSLSDQPMTQCPKLPDIVQFDVNNTETVPLLLGNNKCTCVEIVCNGGLTVAVTNPNATLADIICPAFALSDKCFSFNDECASFAAHNACHPFFHICMNPMDQARCSVCFEDITQELNGVKLFFFRLVNTAVICGSQEPPTRMYFKLLLLNTTSATAEIVFNETTGEICFISSIQVQECGLSQLTQYNVSITDITKNLIFKNDSVTESHCVTVDAPQCGPFHISAHPYTVNNSVVYRFISQEINTGNESFCSCLKESVQFQISGSDFNSVNYTCSSIYLSQFEITIAVKDHRVGERVPCTDGNISVSFDGSCGRVDVCGYWTTTNGSSSFNCTLDCTFLVIPCPITRPAAPHSNIDIALIVSVVVVPLVLVICVTVGVLALIWCICKSVSNSATQTTTSPAQLQAIADSGEQEQDSDAEDRQVQGGGCSNDEQCT